VTDEVTEMSRTIFTAATVLLAFFALTAHVQGERWSISSTQSPVVSSDDDQEQLSYEQLQQNLEEAKAELETTRQQLDAAYQTAQRYGTDEQLEEFREAIGWELNSRDLRELNHEPAGGGDTPGPGGEMGDIATQSNNPVGGLWMMWL